MNSKTKHKKPILWRQRIRKKIRNHETVYQTTRSIVDVYATLFGSFHILPDFLIIGAPRSGTSSLYSYLIKHPLILPCKIKEPNYFSMYYDRSISWYRTFFPTKLSKILSQNNKNSKAVTGEASTQYYWHPHVPARVKKMLPNAKILILLRNPIDRSYSQYEMEVRHGNENLSFEDAIQMEQSRINGEFDKMVKDPQYFSSKYTMYAYLEKSIYVNYLKKWLEYFPKQQFLFINSEDFFSKTQQTLDEIFDFLGVHPYKLDGFEIIRKGDYKPIKKETHQKLLEFFKPHNEELFSILGKTFDWH